MFMTSRDFKMINSIAQALYDKKGFNITALDVRGISTMTDYYLIAEGSVDRHVQALYQEINSKKEEWGIDLYHVEGDQDGDWMVLDCGHIMIHLFIPELREKYALEELWHDGQIIDLQLNTIEDTHE